MMNNFLPQINRVKILLTESVLNLYTPFIFVLCLYTIGMYYLYM